MKDFVPVVVGLVIIGALVYMLANAAAFFSATGLNYSDTIGSLVVTNIGEPKIVPKISEEEAWRSVSGEIGVSPHQGKVLFDSFDLDVEAENPEYEYVLLRASVQNLDAVNISQWKIQSLISGTIVSIPRASLMFKMSEANKPVPVYLAPGEYAYVVTGHSPAGISFHTNPCTGQLSNYAYFQPRLPASCPAWSEQMPATIDNIRTYGEQCISYVNSLYTCEIPSNDTIKKEILPACKAFIRSELTYNKCFDRAFAKDSYDTFNGGGWYLYLEKPAEIWRDKYDVLRLLDDTGKVVDVFSY